MNSILTHHNVGSQFLDLLLSFAGGKKESEAGPGSMILKHHPDGSYEMQYRYSYVEEVAGSSNPWAIRQTGIYHRYVPNGLGNLWIFLHPRQNSTLQKRLEDAALVWEQTKSSRKHWEDVHVLVLSSYFGDWRWYLRSLSAEIERIDLHNLQDKVLPLSLRLRSTLSTILSLKTYYEAIFNNGCSEKQKAVEIVDELHAYDVFLNGHLSSVALLEKRVQEILNLLRVALNLKNQATTVTINRGIWNLTKDTVDDSATVRLVTIVTLIYLPASFVASFLGMNLFSFQTAEGAGFQISGKFWIFALLAVPLTLITVGLWIFMSRKRKRQRKHEQGMQALAGGGRQEV
ncbi:hypothetical protein B0O99DRAFT_653773 [Bisporella sp. PMI_857]|nr:hypothetical protein B0O99DRAFT_653773 [Bisporella sp. PMI_857]